MRATLLTAGIVCLVSTWILSADAETRYGAVLSGTLETRILDRELTQRFNYEGTLTIKGESALFVGGSASQTINIPGYARKDKIFLVYSRFTGDGVTTFHYVFKKGKDGSYDGTLASLIDTRDHVNSGTCTLTLKPQ